MTQQAPHDIAALVQVVNATLEANEPGNISVDEHSGYCGYKPQAIIDTMNDVFGLGQWGFDEIESSIVDSDKGQIAVAKVKAWLAGIDFQPPAWGQSRVTRGDIGDAKKGAQTDALKKALSYFSIGARAYHGLLAAEAQAQSGAKLDEIKAGVKAAGLARNPQQWTAWKKQVLGRDVADEKLTAEQLARLNGKLEQVKRAA